jgi:hypothetical protein
MELNLGTPAGTERMAGEITDMKLLKHYLTEQFKDVAFGEVFAWITFVALLALAVHYIF